MIGSDLKSRLRDDADAAEATGFVELSYFIDPETPVDTPSAQVALAGLAGVSRIRVKRQRIRCLVDCSRCPANFPYQVLRGLGLQINRAELQRATEPEASLAPLLQAAGLTGLIGAGAWLTTTELLPDQLGLLQLVLLALATVIVLGPGRFVLSAGLGGLRRGGNLATGPALAALAALALAMGLFIVPDWQELQAPLLPLPLSAGLLICVSLLGRWLRHRSGARTASAAHDLIARLPATVAVHNQGRDERLPIGKLRPGDLVTVRSSETIPCDGLIQQGTGRLDERLFDPDREHIDRSQGSGVLAGSINVAGLIRLKATAVGADTVLYRLVRAVAASEGQLVQSRGGLIAGLGLLLVALALAAAGLWHWRSPELALAILALTSIGLGELAARRLQRQIVASGARAGVFFSRPRGLNRLPGLDAVAVERGGIVTSGQPRLVAIEPAPGYAPHSILALAAKLEYGQQDPTARSVQAAARECGIPQEGADSVERVPGMGIRGLVDGRDIVLGRFEWLQDLGIDLRPVSEQLEELAETGHSPFCIAIGGQVAGVFAGQDQLREDAAAGIRMLQQRGLEVALVTSDHQANAEATAAALGIERVRGNLTPAGKSEVVRSLQAKGRKVAMIADCDGREPHMQTADLAVSVDCSYRTRLDTVDLIIPDRRPARLLTAIDLARELQRRRRPLRWLGVFWHLLTWATLIGLATRQIYVPAVGALALAIVVQLLIGFGGRRRE